MQGWDVSDATWVDEGVLTHDDAFVDLPDEGLLLGSVGLVAGGKGDSVGVGGDSTVDDRAIPVFPLVRHLVVGLECS